MTIRVLMLELNEVNFECLRFYANKGELPNFSAFFDRHGYAETTSERKYEELEPWIQWVTAHTGLSLAEHKIFRLGDIVNADIEQIWEKLAKQGISVGAISPMNAKCRGKNWDFFIPDPWTKTGVIAPPYVRRMYDGIAQVVNDNAQERILPSSLLNLAVGGIVTARPANYLTYLNCIRSVRRRPWFKAIFLDQLLADLFERSVAKNRTQFATLFLNAAAHIQHHYMFSSPVYKGSMRNPDWYIDEQSDPLFDVYAAYDRILGSVLQRFPDARIMLATGLHQDPHPGLTFYWRLKDHRAFLTKLGVEFLDIEPRMSRDFLVTFDDEQTARRGQTLLESAIGDDGIALFDVDNRGRNLFVMLVYPNDVNTLEGYTVSNRHFGSLIDDVAFVAIKNGRHNGVGYFADSGQRKDSLCQPFPLRTLPDKICSAFA
jgi:hypothetical protein